MRYIIFYTICLFEMFGCVQNQSSEQEMNTSDTVILLDSNILKANKVSEYPSRQDRIEFQKKKNTRLAERQKDSIAAWQESHFTISPFMSKKIQQLDKKNYVRHTSQETEEIVLKRSRIFLFKGEESVLPDTNDIKRIFSFAFEQVPESVRTGKNPYWERKLEFYHINEWQFDDTHKARRTFQALKKYAITKKNKKRLSYGETSTHYALNANCIYQLYNNLIVRQQPNAQQRIFAKIFALPENLEIIEIKP